MKKLTDQHKIIILLITTTACTLVLGITVLLVSLASTPTLDLSRAKEGKDIVVRTISAELTVTKPNGEVAELVHEFREEDRVYEQNGNLQNYRTFSQSYEGEEAEVHSANNYSDFAFKIVKSDDPNILYPRNIWQKELGNSKSYLNILKALRLPSAIDMYAEIKRPEVANRLEVDELHYDLDYGTLDLFVDEIDQLIRPDAIHSSDHSYYSGTEAYLTYYPSRSKPEESMYKFKINLQDVHYDGLQYKISGEINYDYEYILFEESERFTKDGDLVDEAKIQLASARLDQLLYNNGQLPVVDEAELKSITHFGAVESPAEYTLFITPYCNRDCDKYNQFVDFVLPEMVASAEELDISLDVKFHDGPISHHSVIGNMIYCMADQTDLLTAIKDYRSTRKELEIDDTELLVQMVNNGFDIHADYDSLELDDCVTGYRYQAAVKEESISGVAYDDEIFILNEATGKAEVYPGADYLATEE